MLFVVFQIGKDAYAIDVSQVAEVLPPVRCMQIPHSPVGLAGLFNYHGKLVPLIDLTELALGRKSLNKMSTRIILANYERESGQKRLIGLLAEQVVETIRRDKVDFADSGVSMTSTPYLGPITSDNGRTIQQVDVNRLLPPDMESQLFNELVSSSQ